MIALSLLLQSLVLWRDMEVTEHFMLTEPVVLSQSLVLKPGIKVELVDHIPLDEIRVQLFQFKLEKCTPAMEPLKTELILHKEIYGVDLAPGCVLEVFLENSDLRLNSFFSPRQYWSNHAKYLF